MDNRTYPSESPPRAFKGIWIPAELWLDRRLDIEEKALIAEIESLDDGVNHCYASNEYLCTFFNWKERKLQDRLSRLKELGFIEYLPTDGRRRIIKSNLKTIYAEFSTPGVHAKSLSTQNLALSTQYLAPQGCRISHPSSIGGFIEPDNIVYNIDKKEEEERAQDAPMSPADSPRASISSKPIQRAPHVHTTEEEHQKLVEKYGEEKTTLLYNYLNEWKEDTPRSKWKKNDYRSILRWVAAAMEEREKKKAPDAESEAKEFANRVAKNLDHIAKSKGISIEVGTSYVEFRKKGTHHVLTLAYKEKGFREQMDAIMRKIGLI